LLYIASETYLTGKGGERVVGSPPKFTSRLWPILFFKINGRENSSTFH